MSQGRLEKVCDELGGNVAARRLRRGEVALCCAADECEGIGKAVVNEEK